MIQSPYFLRWIQEEEVFLCLEEIDMLQMSMENAFEQLYLEDKELQTPSFDNLNKGTLLLQLKNELLKLPRQKRFQANPYDKSIKVKFSLALLSSMYDVISCSKLGSLTRLQGNIETVLEGYGYAFEDQEPVSEIEALIKDWHRLESEIDEIHKNHS